MEKKNYRRPLSLTPRLMAVAGFFRPEDRVLDIGTDHARLPVYLMERGLCAHASATDISEGPLARARRTVKAHCLDIPLFVCDGAKGLDPEAYDAVSITGMGADTILSILKDSPWLLKKRLILQPQTRTAEFAGMLADIGGAVTEQTVVMEAHRKYHIFYYCGAL